MTLALVCTGVLAAAVYVAAVMQRKRAERAEAENETLREAFGVLKEKAERLRDALDKSAKVKVAAGAERRELAETLDGELVHRANNLFR